MNVLYIVGGEGKRYGSEVIAIDLISAAKKNGINYTVITAKKGVVSDACSKYGVKNYVVPFKFYVYKAFSNKVLNLIKRCAWKLRADLLTKIAVDRIEKELDLEKIDVIHTNLSRDLLGGIIAKKYNIPHVWHIQELYKSHYQLTFLKDDQLNWMIDHSDIFVSISDTVASDWISSGIPKEKVRTIYNGVDLHNILQKDTGFNRDVLRIVMVGHLCSAKGQDIIIKRLSKLSNDNKKRIIVDFYGEGTEDYKNILKSTAKQLGVKVSLKGYCTNIGEKLKEYDVGVNCSRGEGFGLSTVEYMAAGLCSVVSNTGANEEIIKNGVNGYVFDYKEDNSFSEIIDYLLEHRQEMEKVAQTAKKEAFERYSLERMQKDVFDLYKSVAL